MPRPNPVLDRLPTYPSARLEARRQQLVRAGRAVHDFGVGDPDDEVPAFIRRALVDAVPSRAGYPSSGGARGLRGAIAGYVKRRFDVAIDPDGEVMPTHGAKEGVHLLSLLVSDPGAPDDGIGFPDPGYPGYLRGAMFAGARPVPLRLAPDFRLRLWEIPADVLAGLRMVWVNNPQNPTGSVLTREELRRTWEICREHDILLVVDECYADVHDGEPPASILEISRDGVIAVHSLSKRSGLTGYRTGFFAGDARWLARASELRDHLGQPPADFVNAAAAAAWSDDAHAEDRRRVRSARKVRFASFLRSLGYEVLSEATFYVWVKAPGGDGEKWAEELLERGVVATPGSWFATGPDSPGAGFVRFAVVGDDAAIEAAMAAMR